MRKAINITVKLYVEADDEPAHDFAASSIKAVRAMLAAGQAKHPELKVTVKKVSESG